MRQIRSLTVPVVISWVLLGMAPLAVAQTPAEFKEFRRDLAQVLQELDQHTQTLRQNPLVWDALAQSKLDSSQPLAEVLQQLEQMSPRKLAKVYQGFTAAFPNWREAPELMGRLAQQIEAIGPIPQAITPDNCQDAFDAAPSFTDLAAVTAAVIAASAAADIIPPPLNVVAVPFRAGFEVGALTAETLNSIFDRCSGDQSIADIETEIQTIINNLLSTQTAIINNDNSNTAAITNNDNTNTATITNNDNTNRTTIVNNDNTNKNTIVANDDSNKTMVLDTLSAAQNAIITSGDANSAAIVSNDNINKNMIVANDNTNKDTIVANDNTNKDTIVANDNTNKEEIITFLQGFQEQNIRLQIEANLAQSENKPVALFTLPASAGGFLEVARDIVTDLIDKFQDAGQTIGGAQSLLDQANTAIAAGRFEVAYGLLSKAYREIIKH